MNHFFKIVFSETVRESSFTRNSEFKLFRMTAEQMQKFNPDVFGLMQSKLARNHKGLKSFLEQKPKGNSKVYDFNTSNEIQHIENESIDIVVTSPPYGDSRTFVKRRIFVLSKNFVRRARKVLFNPALRKHFSIDFQ